MDRSGHAKILKLFVLPQYVSSCACVYLPVFESWGKYVEYDPTDSYCLSYIKSRRVYPEEYLGTAASLCELRYPTCSLVCWISEYETSLLVGAKHCDLLEVRSSTAVRNASTGQ